MKKLTDCELTTAWFRSDKITVELMAPEDKVEITSFDMDDFDNGYNSNDARKNRALKAVKDKIKSHLTKCAQCRGSLSF